MFHMLSDIAAGLAQVGGTNWTAVLLPAAVALGLAAGLAVGYLIGRRARGQRQGFPVQPTDVPRQGEECRGPSGHPERAAARAADDLLVVVWANSREWRAAGAAARRHRGSGPPHGRVMRQVVPPEPGRIRGSGRAWPAGRSHSCGTRDRRGPGGAA